MVRLNSALEIAVFLLSTTIAVTSAFSAFVADDASVGFALSISNNADLYFSISGPSSCEWVAVGIGSDTMKNALIFMMYPDSSGNNVTLSPRTTSGHVEPSYIDMPLEMQPGSGITNGTMTANARCLDCMTWKDGSLDLASPMTSFIWANGPPKILKSNSLSASVQRHDSYGVFTMNLTQAAGEASVPDLTSVVVSTADVLQVSEKLDGDLTPAAHAAVMILAFVGLLPLGVVILRVFNSPKWHAINQTLSLVFALIGLGLGVSMSTLYNRTKKFNTGHQIFGLIIVSIMIGQFILGITHHRIFKRTSAPTKFAPIHIWLGRLIIPGGLANGFIGFPFAQNPRFNWALAVCSLFIILITAPLLFLSYKRKQAKEMESIIGDGVEGYEAEPWRQQAQGDINLNHMNMNMNMNTDAGVPPPYTAPSERFQGAQQQGYGVQGSPQDVPFQHGRRFV